MATNLPLDRLVRKEVALGTVREIPPPLDHIGVTQIAPFLSVASDDVIFDYAKGLTDGLAPARAEDAESELAQKDEAFYTMGRAAVIDWALKDHYNSSDVTRYRESLILEAIQQGALDNLPLNFVGQTQADFEARLVRDQALRRRKLDNRLEWMIMQAIETGGLIYNDGKIKFTVDYGRPGGQQDQAPGSGNLWSDPDSDPIADIIEMNEFLWDTYRIRVNRAITSRKVLINIINSNKFVARSGLAAAPVPSGAAAGSPVDPYYLIDGWGPTAAQAVVERATGVKFIEYDSVYRTRAVGGSTITNNRFTSENKVFFLPDPQYIAEAADTLDIGFAKTLTSPHPMADWQTGYYEWEEETTDPWGYNVGTGIKAFPVFPLMEYTYTMVVM